MRNEESYKKKVAGGVMTTMIAQFVRIASSTALVIVASRILSPTDYGIYAMAAPVTGLAMMFQNIGFDHAIVQTRDVSDIQISSLFWLNIAICVVLAALLVIASPLVSLFYGNNAIGPLVAVSSLLIIATGPNPLYNALLNRKLHFHAQNLVDIASSITSFVATIVAAYFMHSYWALLGGALAGTVANVIGFMTVERWRPRLVFDWASIAPMVRYGGGVSTFSLTVFVSRNIDKILLARFWGANSLGLYDRGYRLMVVPLQNLSGPLSRNLLPVLARTCDEPIRYRRAYLLFMQAVAAIATPGIIAASADANITVTLLLGNRWAETGPIFAWLSITTPFLLVNESVPWLFMSTNQARRMMNWGFFASTTVVIGFAIGVKWAAIGMAISYFAGEALRSPILFALAARNTPVRFGDFLRLHVVTVVTALACFTARWAIGNELQSLSHLVCMVFVAYIAAIAAQFLTAPGRELMHMAWTTIRDHKFRSRLQEEVIDSKPT